MIMMTPLHHHWNCFLLSEMCLHICIILLTILCPWSFWGPSGNGGGGGANGQSSVSTLFVSAQGAVGLANRGAERTYHTPPAIFTTTTTTMSPSSLPPMVTPTNPMTIVTGHNTWSTGLTHVVGGSSSSSSSSGVGGGGGLGGESTWNETMSGISTTTTPTPALTHQKSSYSVLQMVIIAWVAGCLSLLTVVGNILVMVSFKIDKQLQTISNYFLFSLAVADFIIGLVSMPLFIVYLLMGHWPFGPTICDAWLALDYLASNASVLNLLIISFDRYFSVTRPLTYRARRTTRRAAIMISSAWGISLVLWPPWIYAWPYIEGKRTVPVDECYIQFIETNHYVTFGTAIAAFYVPVSIMLLLYWQIWQETEKRQRDLSQLQAGKKDSSRRSNSSDETVDVEEWKRTRLESCICQDHLDQVAGCPAHRRQSRLPRWVHTRWRCLVRCYVSFSRFCRVDRDPDDVEDGEDEHVSPGCGTPASIETPLQSSVSRCTSLNVIRDPMAQTPTRRNDPAISPPAVAAAAAQQQQQHPPQQQHSQLPQSSALPSGSNGKLPGSDSVYTILIRIPGETEGNKNASIRMIQEPGPLPPLPVHPKAKMISSNPEHPHHPHHPAAAHHGPHHHHGPHRPGSPLGATASTGSSGSGSVYARRTSTAPVGSKLVSKQLTGKSSTSTLTGGGTTVVPIQPKRKKKKNQEKKQEKKAAKTLSAILLAFIVTWTPYNILVLLRTVLSDEDPIPSALWDMAYYLCYINSTINPMCYALCNASFRRTYVRILTCKWDNSRRQAVNRGYYN